jgi:hypothetical protein
MLKPRSEMPQVPVFLPIALRWKPVGERSSRVLDSAYCLLEVSDSAVAEQLRKQVGEGSITSADRLGAPLRLIGRTDARGVLMLLPKGSPLALDPLALSSLSPVLCPLGMSARIAWTQDARTFEDLRRAQEARDPSSGTLFTQAFALIFDEQTELPQAVEEVLVELDEGIALRPGLFAPRAQSFPVEMLRRADDGRTWCIELHDQALELAFDAALRMRNIAGLGDEHYLPAHRVLLDQVLDILSRRGREGDPMRLVIPQHERLCGGEYRALREDTGSVVRRCERCIAADGKTLSAVWDAAFLELSLHPYPEGSFDGRGTGAVPRRWTAQLLMNAAALALRDQLEQTLYDETDPGLDERLLQIASGQGDPAHASSAEQFMARTAAVVAWLKKASSFVQKGVKLATAASDPKLVEPVTEWLEHIVLYSAVGKKTRAIQTAVTRAMRMAQTWEGKQADFEVEIVADQIRLASAPTRTEVSVHLTNAQRWNTRFERAGRVLKLMNALSLWDGMLKPEAERPSVLKQMTDLHGFVDGLEGTYRIFTDTAETELGVNLRSFGKWLGPVGIYLALDDTWDKLQAGNALGAQVAVSGALLGVLTIALELAVASPHPAVKALLVAAGLVLAVIEVYTLDEEEKLLEKYRPRCENAGAYLEAKNAVSSMKSALDQAEWEAESASGRATQLAGR